jgi:hypothetical protein
MRQVLVVARAAAIAAAFGFTVTSSAQAQAPAKAQVSHSHTAPHGGDVMEVGNHHVEFKADSTGTIHVWLLDGKEQTIAPPSGGSVTLIGTGDNQVTLPLQLEKAEQRLGAKFDARRFPAFRAVVSLTIEGKHQNLRFRYPHA